MNPFTQAIAGSVARTLIAALAGAGLLSDGDVERYSGALGILLIGLWSVYQKYRSQQKIVTTGAMAGVSAQEVSAIIASGSAAPVTTPVAAVPIISASR